MDVVSNIVDNVMYINVEGELDEYSASYFKVLMDEIITCNSYKKIILDLGDLSFMDSTGIGVMIGRYKLLKEKNVPLFIINPNRQIDKIFRMSGLYELMPKIS